MKSWIYAKVAALLAGIAVVSLGLTVLFAPPRTEDTSVNIVTSFYPVYIAALNVAGDIDGVTVTNMVDSQTGCLHDYQMSPQDRSVLDAADVLVINGAGAEPFLRPVLVQMPQLPVIDLSEGQTLLESGHVHDHDHEHVHDGEDESATTDTNSHLWVSPLRYRQQVETLTTALCQADPSHAAQYEANAAAYLQKIDAVWTRMQAAVSPFADLPTVLFHDSLGYAAEDLELSVAAALNVGEDSGASTQALRHAEDVLVNADKAMLLYDAQYTSVPYAYLRDLPRTAIVITVNTAVSGADDPDAWLVAMTNWCEAWEAAA